MLLIDGDLRHPNTHTLFEVPQEPGLAEVLRGEVVPTDAIRATSFSRLWVLPAGNGDGHAIQALAQDNVRTLFTQLKQQYDAYDAYTKDIKERGAWVAGEGLDRTSTATTVRVKNGETLTTDGPFAETKEQLGGYFLIEAESLEEASAVAARVPAARFGSVEVRPVVPARVAVEAG